MKEEDESLDDFEIELVEDLPETEEEPEEEKTDIELEIDENQAELENIIQGQDTFETFQPTKRVNPFLEAAEPLEKSIASTPSQTKKDDATKKQSEIYNAPDYSSATGFERQYVEPDYPKQVRAAGIGQEQRNFLSQMKPGDFSETAGYPKTITQQQRDIFGSQQKLIGGTTIEQEKKYDITQRKKRKVD